MGIAQDGSGNIAVQVDGSNNSVTVMHGQARLTLLQRHKRRRQPRKHLDLLDPYSRAIELVGRTDDLAALAAWLEDPAPINVRCLTGRAGSGKTRLALELCERAEGLGWLAGFVAHDELVAFQQRQHLAGWRWPQPTLIIVDYAAAAARMLRSWLEQLAEHQGEEVPRLRLLLLERHASAEAGWWAELTRFGGFGSAGLKDLLYPPVPVALPSLHTVEQRRHVLSSVMAAAARLDGIKPPPQPPTPSTVLRFDQQLSDDLLDNEPLYLMMAGVTAVRVRGPHALASGREDLARQLAQGEVERIGRLARDRGLDSQFLQHLAACVTLTDGISLDDAESLALQEQRALQLPPIDSASFAAALADALPGPTMNIIDAIRPDLIGEAVVLVVFEHARRSLERQAGIVARAWQRAPAQTVAILIRLAQDYAPPDGRHPTLAWLEYLAGLTDDPLALMELADKVPAATTSMRELAAKIQMKVVVLTRAETDEFGRARLAGSLNNLADRLSDLGRNEQALAAAEEAVELYRQLAAAHLDVFCPGLAASLTNLAKTLSDLRRHEPALAAAKEAVLLYRQQAAAHPNAFRPDLAMSLNNLANIACDLGLREPALAVAEEAALLYRQLAAAHPNAFRPDLAMSLTNLANILNILGRREPALALSKKAVALYRQLVTGRPDAFRPGLAGSLTNLANILGDLGRRESALAVAEEAVGLYRQLAAAHPDAFRPNLAISLNNLANRLSNLRRREPALAAAEEALTIRRELAAVRPDAFRPDLAASLNNLANMLSDFGKCKPALVVAEEAVEIYRQLAAGRSDIFHPDLAMSLNNLANIMSDFGRHEQALATAEEAVGLYRQLAAAHPDIFRPGLAASLTNLANTLSDLDRHEPALAAAEESVLLYRLLAAVHPDAFCPDLATSLAVTAACLASCKRVADALLANHAAIKALSPVFLSLPEAFGYPMLSMVRKYRDQCDASGSEPDAALLGPLMPALEPFEDLPNDCHGEGEHK